VKLLKAVIGICSSGPESHVGSMLFKLGVAKAAIFRAWRTFRAQIAIDG
jgi:hypothetical protein